MKRAQLPEKNDSQMVDASGLERNLNNRLFPSGNLVGLVSEIGPSGLRTSGPGNFRGPLVS